MGRVVAWFAGNGREGDGGGGTRRVVAEAACVLASDYSKTLGSLRWLVFFSLSFSGFLSIILYSFGGDFSYARGL